MEITFKNNNVYYYHYKIFNGELSFLLVPLVVILIFYYNNFIKYFSLTLLLIGIVGILDSYYKSKKENLKMILYIGILFHSIGFYPLLNVKKYFEYNPIIYIIGLLMLIITYLLPYWPYSIRRTTVVIIIMSLYIFYSIYQIINKLK